MFLPLAFNEVQYNIMLSNRHDSVKYWHRQSTFLIVMFYFWCYINLCVLAANSLSHPKMEWSPIMYETSVRGSHSLCCEAFPDEGSTVHILKKEPLDKYCNF